MSQNGPKHILNTKNNYGYFPYVGGGSANKWKIPYVLCFFLMKASLSNYMKNNNDILAKELKLNTTTTPNDNVTYETLKTAGEMFIYLNYCPDRLLPLMEHILKNEKPKDIILALTSIKKYPKVSTKESSEKIMRKVLERMNLLQYENFQIITKGKCYVNESFDSCKSKIDLNETNIKQLGLS